jgi:hypothetical protein
MKQGNLLFPSLVTLLLTGFVLTHSGWLSARRASRAAGRHGDARAHARAGDPLNSDAGRRWRNCLPNHWRMYMLQR